MSRRGPVDLRGFDDEEELEGAIFLPPGFPYHELMALAPELEAAGAFTPGYGPPPVGLCHPQGFLYAHGFQGESTILLPDRNVASRIAQIAMGAPATNDLRLVAAIKAFCHFLDILVEPSVAFHELAHKQGNDIANAELGWFRIGDNGDAFAWFDYAIGKIDRIHSSGEKPRTDWHDLAFPLRRWRRNYIVALKIAELELSSLTNIQRMLSLLDWMHRDFIIAGPAAMLACIYFAPKSPPRKGLLKHLSSPDRKRALEGIKNAAWDLTHLSDFIKKVNEAQGKGTRYLFASTDKTLHMMAKFLVDFGADGVNVDPMVEGLSQWWTVDEASLIAERLALLLEDAAEPSRALNSPQSQGFIDGMTVRGENFVLDAGGRA
jgi:hypothetical protein